MGHMLNDWDVVREYLSAHGEATYVELRDVLTARGYRTNSVAFLLRVKRWEREGLVVTISRGEPAQTYVMLLTEEALLSLAERCGYPSVVVDYPDGDASLHIAGSREGWERALPYLSRDGVLKYARLALWEIEDSDASGVPLAPEAHTVRNGNDSQLQLPILEDDSMPIVIRAQSYEPLPTGEYRVVLSAIEEVDTQYGKQLKWTFSVPDENRTLTAYSSISPSVKSKCMQWASVLLNRAIGAEEEVDFEKLVGRSAIATVMRKRKDDGTEYNTVDDLLPLRKPPKNEEDPFA